MTNKFPDSEAVTAGYDDLTLELGVDDCPHISEFERSLGAALDSYRTRTGIDLADVSEKLASGEWVVVPKDFVEFVKDCRNLAKKDAPTLEDAQINLDVIFSKALVIDSMIRASQEK